MAKKQWIVSSLVLCCLLFGAGAAVAGDLEEVLRRGTLRHLGIPYANFVQADQTGLDVELMQGFARYLGVQYEFVESSWQDIVADLIGKRVSSQGDEVEILGESKVRGDVIATGFTVLPWRKKVVDFSTPTFPSGIWVITRADSSLQPVGATGSVEKDIAQVKARLKGRSLLAMANSCLDPNLYGLDDSGAKIQLFDSNRNLNEMIPAVVARVADATLMDVPVALIALEQWPGAIKVIGPVSPTQQMGCAFAKGSPHLRLAFNTYFKQVVEDGTYRKLVQKYYPTVFSYYGKFF